MKREWNLRIDDILDCIDAIEEYSKNKTEDDFLEDRKIQDAIIYRLEIIGEATKYIPQSIRSKYPDIPWRKMAGLRDVSIHDYFDLVINRIWKTVVYDLPKTKNKILKLKKEIQKLLKIQNKIKL